MIEYIAVGILGALVGIAGATWYYIHRVWDLRRECEAGKQQIHTQYEMQRRVYGEVPIEKLVGREGT